MHILILFVLLVESTRTIIREKTDVLAGKKALFIQARGGEYKSPEMQGLDFATPYIRTTFHSLGLIDFKYLHIEGTMSKPEMANMIEKNAVQKPVN